MNNNINKEQDNFLEYLEKNKINKLNNQKSLLITGLRSNSDSNINSNNDINKDINQNNIFNKRNIKNELSTFKWNKISNNNSLKNISNNNLSKNINENQYIINDSIMENKNKKKNKNKKHKENKKYKKKPHPMLIKSLTNINLLKEQKVRPILIKSITAVDLNQNQDNSNIINPEFIKSLENINYSNKNIKYNENHVIENLENKEQKKEYPMLIKSLTNIDINKNFHLNENNNNTNNKESYDKNGNIFLIFFIKIIN